MNRKTKQKLLILMVVTFIIFPSELNAQQEYTTRNPIGDNTNWIQLIDNANRKSLSMRDSSDNALEKDLKRNLDNWGNKDQKPFYMHMDSIFYRVFYAENIFNILTEVDDFKESFIEMQMYIQPYDAVQVLLNEMAEHNKTLYLLMVSKETNRQLMIPLYANEYKLFGIHAKK